MISVSESYRLCRQIARQKAKNFYYAFLLLPQDRMDPMCSIYAFMRHSDDVIDSNASSQRADELLRWKEKVTLALEGISDDDPVLPAFADTVNRFSIPHHYFYELLDGVGMDLQKNRYQTFEELYQYCYRVASVVGIVCLYIFGFKDQRALKLAEATGIAFQITNILRDLEEDGRENRVYLPLEDLLKFHYSVEQLKEGVSDDHFRALFDFEIARARDYYQKGEELVSLVNPECRRTLAALTGIYRTLLDKIDRQRDQVFTKRIRLSIFEKLAVLFRSWRQPVTAILP